MTLPKRTMIRLVKTSEGVMIDPTGKAAGRGAYLHDHLPCWEVGLKGALAHALKTDLTPADRERLLNFMATLPVEESGVGKTAIPAVSEVKTSQQARPQDSMSG
jgi:predicted RNA-binding protein YlxR (DUF448 family)